jgi:hypothetical protein
VALVITDLGVRCWAFGGGPYDMWDGIMPPKNLKNVRKIFAGGTNTCALADNGLRCWGYTYAGARNLPLNVPRNLKNPKTVTIYTGCACALTDDGYQCWGEPGCREPSNLGKISYP